MRYIKVLLVALIFFLSMVFFFQNQASLATPMVLHLNLFFIDPMESISLPLYFLVLAAFLLGALASLLLLVWDKMHLSARHMKATWRVRALEKEVTTLKAAQEPKAVNAPKTGGLFSRKPREDKSLTASAVPLTSASTTKNTVEKSEKNFKHVEDITAPDPDKHI